MTELVRQLEACADVADRAAYLLALPYANLLDRSLGRAIEEAGSAEERLYVDVNVAWLLATRSGRAEYQRLRGEAIARLSARLHAPEIDS